MIVIVNDERWITEGIIDYLEDKSEKIDIRYTPEFFSTPIEALGFIMNNADEIDIIISDIMMDFGDGNINIETKGGAHFINRIRLEKELTNIPIIINTIFHISYFENELNHNIDNEFIFYTNTNNDPDSSKLYEFIDMLLMRTQN